jgi:type IV secretion system protein VirB11
MGILLKTTLLSNESGYYLEQEEHYRLNVLANNISEMGIYYHKQPIPDEDLKDLNLFITKINKRLKRLIGILFRVKIETVTKENHGLYNQAPQYLITKEFVKMTSSKAEQIMGILAAASSVHFHEKEPRLECSIPFYHHRFTGQRQPFVKFPSFTIRKHSSQVIPLDEHVENGLLPEYVAETIRNWILRGYNILIGGGTGSGKTTLLNTLLLEMAEILPESLNRVGIIEDTPEIQNSIDNSFEFVKTKEVSMDDALVSALRMRPNSIIVGEVRGKEAYTLFKAMLTGHTNCMGTIHASGAYETTFRYEQCIKEHPDCRDMPVPREQICLALNGIISIQKTTVKVQRNGYWENVVKRKVTALREITGYDPKHQIYEDIMYYQDKEAVLEKTQPVNTQFSQYQ